ncbi:AP-5 complex subunit zeta-1 [Branchiostoma belcheri]|nr:AP-5 complex subunit zeta-1 [Branchiostoma belcheri]
MTVPKKRTEEQISKELSIMIRDGEVPIGEFVVPKSYKKYFLNKDNKHIETTTITMEGRKQHLLKVREQLLESQQPFMREATNYDLLTREQIQQRLMELGEYNEEETEQSMRKRLKSIEGTRHLVPWEDGATLANHGYIVYVVTTLYDPAIHLTDEEYYQKYNLRLSVQSAVEQPRIYIIARSKSSDAEQLLYSETRRDDLPSLAVPVTAPDGREYRDILRFCKGDCPSRQFEMGQQRGGFHPCLCAVDIREVHSFFTCTHVENPAQSMEDRQKFILDGPITSQKASSSLPDPFSQMTKEEMKDELTSRGAVPYETVDTMTKHDLQQEMKKMLRGIKRMPALLQPNPTQDLTELNLQHLEAPACESMHDLYNHTKNILEELPAHVSREVVETIQTVKTTILGNKDTVRAVDMRWLLLVLIKELEKQGQAEEKVMTLLSTLAEMQRLCYAAAEDRNMTSIFRMQNTMFLHHLMLRECFPGNPKNITRRKLWGQYIHSLRDHTPVIFRVAPISSLLAENEERQFGTFKRITKASANYANAGHIITNIFVRSIRGTHKHTVSVCQTSLLPGYGIHWHIEEEVVVFHDAPSQDTPSHPTGQTPHHFRSTSIKQEHEYLQQTWERCLQEGVPMPISRIWVYEGQHLAKRMTTPFLDTGHVFTGQKYPYMEDISEPENPEVEEEPDYGEMEETEDEEVIRMDRVDPEPELEQLEDETEIMKPDEQAAASQVVFRTPLKAINGGPCQSPSDIRSRTERRGLASCLSPESTPVSTPPRTPMREVERTTGNFDDESTKCSSLTTPTSARSGSVNLQGIMTPPATPCPVKNKSRDESKWRTKLGTALAVVLGDVPLVHQADKMKSKLKTAPKDKQLKAEYDTCTSPTARRIARRPKAGGRSDPREGWDRGAKRVRIVPRNIWKARAVRGKNPRAVPLVITRAGTPVSNVIAAQLGIAWLKGCDIIPTRCNITPLFNTEITRSVYS